MLYRRQTSSKILSAKARPAASESCIIPTYCTSGLNGVSLYRDDEFSSIPPVRRRIRPDVRGTWTILKVRALPVGHLWRWRRRFGGATVGPFGFDTADPPQADLRCNDGCD